MRIFFGEDYPSKPPKVRFTCEMFHPNGISFRTHVFFTVFTTTSLDAVYSDGVLCLDIIQDQWKPIYTVASILTSIQVPRRIVVCSRRSPMTPSPSPLVSSSLILRPWSLHSR